MKFVLMPDGVSASHFRGLLAERNTVEVKVGTFSTLLETLNQLWILSNKSGEFSSCLKTHALQETHTFWSKSIIVDETGTLSELTASLKHLLNTLPVDQQLPLLSNPQTRIENYYNDLVNLHKSMEYLRPAEQEQAKQWLNAAQLKPIEDLKLIYLPELFSLNEWQAQIVSQLESLMPKHKPASEEKFDEHLQSLLIDTIQTSGNQTPELQQLTNRVFQSPNIEESINLNNIRCLTCRDSLEEIEVVVGMIQQALEQGITLNEVALVIPQNADYLGKLPGLLNKAGILTSNRHTPTNAFQWDLQLLKDLLIYFSQLSNSNRYSTPMSLAAIVTNPLMPWSKSVGQKLADACFQGSLTSNIKKGVYKNEYLKLLELFDEPTDQWQDWCNKIIELLEYPIDSRIFSHSCIQVTLDELIESFSVYVNDASKNKLSQNDAIRILINQLQPRTIEIESELSGQIINGLLVLTENEWLLKPVEHLFIIGFNQGNYGSTQKAKSVFSLANWKVLNQLLDIDLDPTDKEQQHFEKRMVHLLSQAEKSITFLLSEQDLSGDILLPSETLLDIVLCFQSLEEINPESVLQPISEMHNPSPFFKERLINNNEQSNNTVDKTHDYEALQEDLELGIDLIELHKDREGNTRADSPSSLEKMMISPLAWLLNRQGLEPKSWEVQELNIALRGTIAHKVFELHFDENNSLNSNNFDALYKEALKIEADFVLLPQWRLERTQLKHEIKKALIPFIDWCKEEGWTVSETEMRLSGSLWTLPMKGFVDSVLTKGEQYLILDYKKSSSKNRIERLENGYDLQTVIYRELFEQLSILDNNETHSGYYTLNDNKLVLDTYSATAVDDIEQVMLNVGIQDQSKEAVRLIKERIKQLRKGSIALNTVDDTEKWQDLGVTATYYIDTVPLVGHFLKPAEDTEHE